MWYTFLRGKSRRSSFMIPRVIIYLYELSLKSLSVPTKYTCINYCCLEILRPSGLYNRSGQRGKPSVNPQLAGPDPFPSNLLLKLFVPAIEPLGTCFCYTTLVFESFYKLVQSRACVHFKWTPNWATYTSYLQLYDFHIEGSLFQG